MTPIAVITDWGGVLTAPLNSAIARWLATDQIDVPHYKEVMRAWFDGAYQGSSTTGNLIHGLEDGSLAPQEFERLLAVELRRTDGGPVTAEGLIDRMFAEFAPVEPMYAALRAVRAAGFQTGLLSNSWGNAYPRELWGELFDCVVISGEVGMRKPAPEIFQHTVSLLGLRPDQCVFVDDIVHNVTAAEELGMIGVHHTDVIGTQARLGELFKINLSH
ncbi:MAG: HAD family phosphatase [Streptosporangiaceae bacterium]